MIRAVLAIALVILLPSCRSLTGPERSARVDPVAAPRPAPDAAARNAAREVRLESLNQVPRVVRIDAVANQNSVIFRFHLAPEQSGDRPFYDPHTPGGWQFQLFLDLDEDPLTGYAGYDLLTRDSEPDLPPSVVVLRHTEGGGGPGGWGDAVAELPVRVLPRLIFFRVPLERLDDDGALRFGLDLYATVAGGPSGTEPVAAFARSYSGTTRWLNHEPVLAVGGDPGRFDFDRTP